MRLSTATLGELSPSVERFVYDRNAQAIGIVHFGIGAFHRAHQAWYTDRAMDFGDRNWAIAGVSLRSASVADQLNPQDGLYTVAERTREYATYRLIGSVREVSVATANPQRAVELIANRSTRIATFTVTEKGYCRTTDGNLDFTQAEANAIYPLLANGLGRRKKAGLNGLTIISCDNLPHNGRVLERLLAEYLDRVDPVLASWVAETCTFPSTMVDRIVPATTPTSLDDATLALGLDDFATVATEPFSQWVIEDRFAGERPRWEAVGGQIVADVVPYETAKLRMLNGAHSALAYLGLERGHRYVHEAAGDLGLRSLIDQLMRVEAATSFTAAPGQNLERYADDLLERFDNPALNHKLSQIAMDGSQKIPQRWLATLADQRDRQTDCPAILTALGAWLRHCRGDNLSIDDPLAGELAGVWQRHDCRDVAKRLLGTSGLLASPWEPKPDDLDVICASGQTA